MDNCLFCKIAAGEIPSNKVYEDDKILAFHDINPVAPVHILFILKEHVASSADEVDSSNSHMVAYIFENIAKVCRDMGVKSYRIVNNCGKDAGQTVGHLHFHVIGGRDLSGTMG